MKGFQLPDFSLRSQTFLLYCKLFYYFLYILKTKTFCAFHHKTTSKYPKIQKFWHSFAKYFCDFKQKWEKRPNQAGSSCALCEIYLPCFSAKDKTTWPIKNGKRHISTIAANKCGLQYLKNNSLVET